MVNMILNTHPDMHSFLPEFRKDNSSLKFIGYWHSVLIDPQSLEIVQPGHEFDRYEKRFGITGLPIPSDYVDITWDVQERERVASHLKNGKEWENWRGSSFCRFGCKDVKLGYRDFTDGTYVWPEGFVHYVSAHNVKPAQEFINHILGER